MKLLRKPRVPTQFQLHDVASKLLPNRVHTTWAPYLGLELEGQSSKGRRATASHLL